MNKNTTTNNKTHQQIGNYSNKSQNAATLTSTGKSRNRLLTDQH